MRIVFKDQEELVEFQDLQVREVFIEDVDGAQFIQMKIESVAGANAVMLTDGYTC